MAGFQGIKNGPKRNDISGQRFGKLVAARRIGKTQGGHSIWECHCDCGTTKTVVLGSLKSGVSRSCGCLMRGMQTTHGMSGTPEYIAWCSMIARCHRQSSQGFGRYGARGIEVCQEWRDSFEAFYSDMGNRPSSQHSIERSNNSLGYSKDNCIWGTREQQNSNKRSNVYLEAYGLRLTAAQWSKISGTSRKLITNRILKGWEHKPAVFAYPIPRGLRNKIQIPRETEKRIEAIK